MTSAALSPKHRAFTLVELLVVISIIALLSSIILPITSKVRGYARRTRCCSSLGQLGKALNLYVDDHDHWYPCASCMPSTEPEGGLPRIRDLLARYIGPAIFECPDDRPADPEYHFRSFFIGEGSSYEWAELLNRLKVGQPHPFAPIDLALVPILRDYQPFHTGSGRKGINGLFVDGRVESF